MAIMRTGYPKPIIRGREGTRSGEVMDRLAIKSATFLEPPAIVVKIKTCKYQQVVIPRSAPYYR
jgi:hypothetical protein